jgi:hypothetical protein
MSQEAAQDHYEKQRRSQYHASNLQGSQEPTGETTQILNTLSEIEDLPIQPQDDKVMGQLVSKLTSTANLTEAEVRSNEWVREYILILYLCQYPTPDGCHGSWRGWAHGDSDEEIEPMKPSTRLQLETLVTTSKLALSRSEDAKVIEEGTRNVSESIVSDENGSGNGGSGLLGKLGL